MLISWHVFGHRAFLLSWLVVPCKQGFNLGDETNHVCNVCMCSSCLWSRHGILRFQVESASWPLFKRENKSFVPVISIAPEVASTNYFEIVALLLRSRKKIQWPPKRTNFHRCLVMMVHLVMASDDKAQPSECIQGGGHRLPVGWGGLENFFTSRHIAVKLVQELFRSKRHFWNQI